MIQPQESTAIAVRGLQHSFGGLAVLNDINLDVQAGTVTALLGPSGCGKSTLLKALAGLLLPQSGTITFGQRTVHSATVSLPPEQRSLGMVFQDYALWPHMTIAGNVAFPLQMRGVSKTEQANRVQQALELVGLSTHATRRPAELSGGQQQRVALARAIVSRPRVLLFDEPLSNLDRTLRENLCTEIGTLLSSLGTTAVYVTHDHAEAYALAHQIAHMEAGRIRDVQPNTPSHAPSSPSSSQVVL